MGRLFRDYGSTADVVVVIIMKPVEEQAKNAAIGKKPACSTPERYRNATDGNPPLTKLPPEDEEILAENGVKVMYTEIIHGDKLDFRSLVTSPGGSRSTRLSSFWTRTSCRSAAWTPSSGWTA
mmetsp:Transcript_36034/g.113203  ORF Transcript_36034/g.113203 Transcript_36034/m.113203 type:complete len:123 (+) Transcript_36034:274-642(+)